jgi:hypothetical protein
MKPFTGPDLPNLDAKKEPPKPQLQQPPPPPPPKPKSKIERAIEKLGLDR